MSEAAADLRRQAESAANDAAADARAEVLERAERDRDRARPKAVIEGGRGAAAALKEREAKAKATDPYVRFMVDVWITDLNSIEFGIFRRDRNKAKSRQFTSDMDIFAEITENGERTGLLGYREDLWKKNKGFDRRLVFKLFGEKLNWHATMDLMLARSIQETVGARGLPVSCFAANTNDHDQMVYLTRSANKWRFLPEHFSFFLVEDGVPKFYRLKQDLISIGMDYSLYDGQGNKIGLLDGKLLTLGGLWKCKVKAEHADKRLMTMLKLFVGMLVFNRSCRRHIRDLARELEKGTVKPKIERQEGDLYMNPRRVR